MLIPKCCKNCANKGRLKFGTGCICDAPSRCGELVEEDEDIKRYEEMVKSAPQLGNWVQCPDCEDFKKQIKDKDHRIAVLEKALELCVNVLQREIDGDYIKATETQAIYEIGKDYFINQAEKELEEKK